MHDSRVREPSGQLLPDAASLLLEQLRRRMGMEQRLTARSLTNPLRQATLVLR